VQANRYHKTLLLPCHSYELPQLQRDRSHLGRQITRLTPRSLFLCSVCVLLSLGHVLTCLLGRHMLSMDLLAIYMVRNVQGSTIISYHPESTSSPANHLHSLMLLVGDSVYWQNIFSKSKDPTFFFLAVLWYALYAWDESLESLSNHVRSLVRRPLVWFKRCCRSTFRSRTY